jgi:hypothetical protein
MGGFLIFVGVVTVIFGLVDLLNSPSFREIRWTSILLSILGGAVSIFIGFLLSAMGV